MSEEAVKVLPVLPLKNTVLFPYLLMPLSVGPQFLARRRAGSVSNRRKGDRAGRAA